MKRKYLIQNLAPCSGDVKYLFFLRSENILCPGLSLRSINTGLSLTSTLITCSTLVVASYNRYTRIDDQKDFTYSPCILLRTSLLALESFFLYKHLFSKHSPALLLKKSFKVVRVFHTCLTFSHLVNRKDPVSSLYFFALLIAKTALNTFCPLFGETLPAKGLREESELLSFSVSNHQDYKIFFFKKEQQDLCNFFHNLFEIICSLYDLQKQSRCETSSIAYRFQEVPRPAGLEQIFDKISQNSAALLFSEEFRLRAQNDGLSMPKGILLYGPSGTGKTMLARYLACEYFSCKPENIQMLSGSELIDCYYGETERKIRMLFEKAKKDYRHYLESAKTRPCNMHVIVIDEIDSILAKRRSSLNSWGGSSAVHQFLSEMDGLDSLGNVIVIATTNFKDSIDPAALRSCRFDLQIEVSFPDHEQRLEVFKFYAGKENTAARLEESIDFSILAQESKNLSPADIAEIFRSVKNLVVQKKFQELELAQRADLSLEERYNVALQAKISQRHFIQAIYDLRGIGFLEKED